MGQNASKPGHQSTFTLHCMSYTHIALETWMFCLSYCASCNMFRQACLCQHLPEFGVQLNAGLYRKCDIISLCYMCSHFDNIAWTIKLVHISKNRLEWVLCISILNFLQLSVIHLLIWRFLQECEKWRNLQNSNSSHVLQNYCTNFCFEFYGIRNYDKQKTECKKNLLPILAPFSFILQFNLTLWHSHISLHFTQ